MKLFQFRSKIVVKDRLVNVFPFFANAMNLQEITPAWLNFEIISSTPIDMKPGQTIDYRLKVRGFPLRWRSEITAWEPPYRFVDEQVRGPYRVWHHEHIFTESEGQTVCEDNVKYAVWGGTLVNRLLVERDVKRIFEYRRRRLLETFPGASNG